MVVVPEIRNTTLPETTFPLSFQNFVSEQMAYLAKYAYEQAITRKRNLIVASHQCLEATNITAETDGTVTRINGKWQTHFGCVDVLGYKQHLVNLYGEQETINCHVDATERILDLIDPDRQCLLYLQQGIFLTEDDIYWNDERFISDLIEFPVSLSSWYTSTFVTPNRKPRQQPEQNLEIELFNWLQIHGVEVERQVSTKNHHRLDLWIPGRMMLELKASKVTGDDVCQAIDYYATYQRPIILIGKGLSTAASRGIEGFTREISQDALVFVTWPAIKTYLLGALNIRGYVTG